MGPLTGVISNKSGITMAELRSIVAEFLSLSNVWFLTMRAKAREAARYYAAAAE